MHPQLDPDHVIAEALEGLLLGTLTEPARVTLEAHLAEDAALRDELEATRKRVIAVQHSVAKSDHGATADVSDDTLASYLDHALSGHERAALELQFSANPQLVTRLAALFRAAAHVTDSNSAVVLSEKFLAGTVIPFERGKSDLTSLEPAAYLALEDALEARKRRYLRG